MRILINTVFLTSEHLGGSWAYTANLVSRLTRLPSAHEFLIMTNRESVDRLDCDAARAKKVVVDLNVNSRIRRVAWEQISLPRIVKQQGIDLVHSTGNVLPLHVGVPAIVTLHDLQYLDYPQYFPFLRRMYLTYFVPRSVSRAAAIITISEFTKQHICRSFKADPGKIHVTYLAGLLEKSGVVSGDDNDVRKRFGLKRPYLMAVGSSLPHKNLPRLISAFAGVSADVPYDLVIVGESGANKQVLETAVELAGLSGTGRVRFTGFVTRRDLVALYHDAEAVVIPSLYEGFGIPAIEAMDCGCPVLAANCTALPEIVGDAAMLFEPTDVADIGRALKEFHRDPSLRLTLKEKGTRRAEGFSWEKVAAETLQLYDKLMESRNKRIVNKRELI